MARLEHYHPGTCEATARGKRYGRNLVPQRYDGPGHVWQLAKTINWGPWSCCGRLVNATGCQLRETRADVSRGVGAHVQFLINERAKVLVVGEDEKCWLLSSGRVAKKHTDGSSWVWAAQALDRFSRLSIQEQHRPYYSFGNWGYHTNAHDGQLASRLSTWR